MSSQCVVPNWVVRSHEHGQEPDEDGGGGKRSTHVHSRHDRPPRPHPHPPPLHPPPPPPPPPSPPTIFPKSMNGGLTELAWENGNLAMHGLGGLPQCPPLKQSSWLLRAGDTLESVVHQATATCNRNSNTNSNIFSTPAHNFPANNINDSSMVASSGAKSWPAENSSYDVVGGTRARRKVAGPADKLENHHEEWVSRKKQCSREDELDDHEFTNCMDQTASIRETDATTMTWPSFESPNSLKTKTTEDDSTSLGAGTGNPDEEVEKKIQIRRSRSSRRSRAAAIHNQSERRRRDRINEKMKALQKLIPNSSKTDKASILDEVIDYLKQLQAQLQLMSARSSMPQLMMPLGMQQLQMSLMARMAGMGMGLGMGMATAAPPAMPPILHPTSQPSPAFVPPHNFLFPSLLPTHTAPPPPKADAGTSPPITSPDPYSAFVAQSMNNMNLFNKMTTLFRQQMGLPASANPNSHAKESGL